MNGAAPCPAQEQICNRGLSKQTFPTQMPQWDINFVSGNCPFSLMLSDFLVLFPSSLAPTVVSVSLCWPMYSITTDGILLDRKYGCYILHSYISTIKGLSLSQSSLQILREGSVCPYLGLFPTTGRITCCYWGKGR